jgi:[ribosomal protein S18]-alanine N-acetyltransferase
MSRHDNNIKLVGDFRLRDFRMADFETLYRLDQACFEPGIAYSRGQLREFLALSTARTVVAERQGKIVGFATGYVSIRGLGHVVTLDVAQEHRRGGIGGALLKELLRRFAAALVQETRLEVDGGNDVAISFYERFGFRKLRRLADYYGPDRPAWEMTLGSR